MTITSPSPSQEGASASGNDDRAALYSRRMQQAQRTANHARVVLDAEVAALPVRPSFQILVDLGAALPTERAAVLFFDGMQGQAYRDWFLTILHRGDTSAPEGMAIVHHYARVDPRICAVPVATGGRTLHRHLIGHDEAWTVIIDRPGVLAPDALLRVAQAINSFREAAILYTDEDHLVAPGEYRRPFIKTLWDPTFGLSQDLFGGLKILRADLATRCGSAVSEGAAWPYDLSLRATELVELARVVHLPYVLFHRTQDLADADQRRIDEAAVVRAALKRRGVRADVVTTTTGVRRVVPRLDDLPTVSVLIPTRDKVDFLRRTVEGVLGGTDYPSIEVILIDNGSQEAATLDYLHQIGQRPDVTVLRVDAPFNFSDINNRAVGQATGGVVLFLNNDVEVTDPRWLREMVAQVMRFEVGAVGALLFYPNGSIQHAGVVTGANGSVAEHVALHEAADWIHQGVGATERPVSAVTAACMAVRRSVFYEVGGFDTALAVSYNDVDLCLRLRQAGYTILWTPAATLIHHESVSRQSDLKTENRERAIREDQLMRDRWGTAVRDDPWHPRGYSLTPLRWWSEGSVRPVAPWADCP